MATKKKENKNSPNYRQRDAKGHFKPTKKVCKPSSKKESGNLEDGIVFDNGRIVVRAIKLNPDAVFPESQDRKLFEGAVKKLADFQKLYMESERKRSAVLIENENLQNKIKKAQREICEAKDRLSNYHEFAVANLKMAYKKVVTIKRKMWLMKWITIPALVLTCCSLAALYYFK